MNFLQMADEVLTRLGAATDDAALTATIRKSFVNSALRSVDALLENPYWASAETVLTTVVGQNMYAVPANWSRTVSLRLIQASIPSETVLPYQPKIPFRRVTTTGEARPRAWTHGSVTLILWPTPDAVYTYEHRYQSQEPTLTADGDLPLLPARFHDAVVEKACTLAARRIGQYDRAAAHQKEFELLVPAILAEQDRGGRPPALWRRPEGPK